MVTTTPAYTSDTLPEQTIDAVVIGGGAAGLNGALMLARSGGPWSSSTAAHPATYWRRPCTV